MKIAIPLAEGKLTAHFGHCASFAIIEIEDQTKKSSNVKTLPRRLMNGLLPPWLAKQGANMIIAGGMGQRAQQLFAEQGIQVVVGAPVETPEKLITDFFAGSLQVGDNLCDH